MKLRQLRQGKGWTQGQLAQRLHTTQKAISDYENGKRRPPVQRLPVIAQIFGVTTDDLLGATALTVNEPTPHVHGNSRVARVQELYEKLPPTEQRSILKQIKALVDTTA